MRRRKRLVQVHVNDIEVHITRSNLAQNGVQVGTVVVQQATGLMHHIGDVLDVTFEHAQRRWVGQHDARGLRTEDCLQLVHIDVAVRASPNLLDHTATHRCRRRIGTMCSIGNDNLVAFRVATRFVVGLDHRHARQFALCAGHRR